MIWKLDLPKSFEARPMQISHIINGLKNENKLKKKMSSEVQNNEIYLLLILLIHGIKISIFSSLMVFLLSIMSPKRKQALRLKSTHYQLIDGVLFRQNYDLFC
jgi:hypothetical protein